MVVLMNSVVPSNLEIVTIFCPLLEGNYGTEIVIGLEMSSDCMS
jgi:hypothetical protein